MARDKGFEMFGVKELSQELMKLGRNIDKIITPGMDRAGDTIENQIKRTAPVDEGDLRKEIKRKTFKTNKNVAVRIGVLDTNAKNSKGRPIAKYAGVQESRTNFMSKALKSSKKRAEQQMINTTQRKLNAFHAAQPKAKR